MLSPAHLPHQSRLRGEFVAADIAPVARALGSVNWLAVELGQQDMSNRMQYGFGCAFEKIGQPNVELRVPQANGVIDRDKRIKADAHRRRGHARPQFGVGFVEDLSKSGGHGEVKISTRVGCRLPCPYFSSAHYRGNRACMF